MKASREVVLERRVSAHGTLLLSEELLTLSAEDKTTIEMLRKRLIGSHL